ncbi:MAG: hypothetical protein Q8M93_06030 [Polaromonas sp.]|uniref:hypothetical protein n=1 Tax=Polaromonas sp. TaxID=1869339 RepID=UPI0027318147|nr:hypothetical protein [Polaromonas sp.]MDP2450513.1 hypothetical protein [Polaromonas sp.]MDP3246508.1 hypothetical protein [Polaromonas sp.]MDP3755515.1 hypothetical protein [Polaromonas sp.]
MSDVEKILCRWKESLCESVSLGGLLSRNPTAHKWKATYRSLVLRETVFWRVNDLLTQAHMLYEAKHILGSRILIRSALESVATLIHLNQITAQVLAATLDFYAFDEKIQKLMLGSKNGSTKHESINIVTVLKHCDKKYKGLSNIYATLSECAHPNFEGVCFGYSEINCELDETHFSNKWETMWADRHESLVKLVCLVFETEYNDIWSSQFEDLEIWLTKNDSELEVSKGKKA